MVVGCEDYHMTQANSSRTLATIERANAVIDALEALHGARVTELADHLDLAQSTVHGYLTTLEQNEYLVKEGDEYHIGMKFLRLGGYASSQKPVYKFAKRKVKNLATETGERAQFIVEEHGRGTYLHTETGDSAVQIDARIGKQTHLHASAAGKAILANLPPDRLEEIIDHRGLPRITENTVVDRDQLGEELSLVKEQSYSFNRDESVVGLRAVGAPVIDSDGHVLGALSISAPSNRMQGDRFTEEIPMILLGAANEIELNIAYP